MLGNKVAGQEGRLLLLLALGGLIPGLVKQLVRTSGDLYQSGTQPYQERGFLLLLALRGVIPGSVKQLGGSQAFQTLSKIAKQGVIPNLVKKQNGKG